MSSPPMHITLQLGIFNSHLKDAKVLLKSDIRMKGEKVAC